LLVITIGPSTILTGSSGCSSTSRPQNLTRLEQSCLDGLKRHSQGKSDVLKFLNSSDLRLELTKETMDVYRAVLEAGGTGSPSGSWWNRAR
jgi:hypothetical protein